MYDLKRKNKWINYANNSTEEYYHETINNVPIDIENHLTSVKNIRVMIIGTMNRFVKKLSKKKIINGINPIKKIQNNIGAEKSHSGSLSAETLSLPIKSKVKKKKKIKLPYDNQI